jgi:hypothetical protein
MIFVRTITFGYMLSAKVINISRLLPFSAVRQAGAQHISAD